MKGYKQGTRKIKIGCRQCGATFVVHMSREAIYCSRDCAKESKVFLHNVPHSEATKKLISEKKKLNPTGYKVGHPFHSGGEKGWFKKGVVPWNWRGGERSLSQMLKDDSRWKVWRKKVFERDHYTCQNCGDRGCYVHPHHIKSKVKFPELAFEVSNGMTLCVPCHKLTDNYGARALKKCL